MGASASGTRVGHNNENMSECFDLQLWKEGEAPSEIYLQSSNTEECSHSSKDLFGLLTYLYENVDNIPRILETIIDPENSKEEHGDERAEIISRVSKRFNYALNTTNARGNLISDFRKTEFSLKKNTFQKISFSCKCRTRKNITPHLFLHALKSAICFLKQDMKGFKQETIKEVIEFFQDSSPACAAKPPLMDYHVNSASCRQNVSTSSKLLTHGIAINRMFLFLLLKNLDLLIYPIYESGCLGSKIERKLDIEFNQPSDVLKISMYATPDKLVVHSNNYYHTFKLDDMLKCSPQEIVKGEKREHKKQFAYYVGNGVTHCQVLKEPNECVVKIFNSLTEKKIRIVKLREGYHQLNKNISSLFPTISWDFMPFYLTGPYLVMTLPNTSIIVFRAFSLITGQHVIDSSYPSDEKYFSRIYDAYHNCIWSVIQRESFLQIVCHQHIGSIDPLLLNYRQIQLNTKKDLKYQPDKPFHSLARTVSPLMLHYVGSFTIVEFLMDKQMDELIDMIWDYIKIYGELPKVKDDIYVGFLQTLVISLDVQITLCRVSSSQHSLAELHARKLLDLVRAIPEINMAAALFFNNISFFDQGDKDECISLMIKLISSMDYAPQLDWALGCIEKISFLSKVPLGSNTPFGSLFPAIGSPLVPMPKPPIQALLYVHQRVLIWKTCVLLTQHPFEKITLKSADDKPSSGVLGNFAHYCSMICQLFSTALDLADNVNQLVESQTFGLFSNFVIAMSKLSSFHTVAQANIPIFDALISNFRKFAQKHNISLDVSLKQTNQFCELFLHFIFLYGKLSATLIMGGELSLFEEKYIWLLRANIDLVNDAEKFMALDSDIIGVLGNEGLDQFIKKQNSKQMDAIYKKYKPTMNRNLTPEIKLLDKLLAASFAKHNKAFDQLRSFNDTSSVSKELKAALDQMLRVRGHVRQAIQRNNADEYKRVMCKTLLLLRMDSDFGSMTDYASCLGDFVLNTIDTPPERVKKILQYQITRVQFTLAGFELVDNSLRIMADNKLFQDIFAFALSHIERFEGLSAIIRICKDLNSTQKATIERFFSYIVDNIISKDPGSDRLVLVLYRFFRDINVLDYKAGEFFGRLIDIPNGKNGSLRYSVFALAFSLIKKTNVLPKSFYDFSKLNHVKYIIFSELLNVIPCPEELFDKFYKIFWSQKSEYSRLTCRLLYRMLGSKELPQNKVKSTLEHILKMIGKLHIQHSSIDTQNADCTSNMELAYELVWICRRIFIEKHQAAPILEKLMLSASTPNSICGFLAILGNSMENIRPYCRIKHHKSSSYPFVEYIYAYECQIPRENNPQVVVNRLKCYKTPFSLGINPDYLVRAVGHCELSHVSPLLELEPSMFGHYDYVLSLFDKIFSSDFVYTKVLYVQVLASYCRDPQFTALFTAHHVNVLSQNMLPFAYIDSTLYEINRIYQANVEMLPQKCGFYCCSFSNNQYYSYLTPAIHKNVKKFTIKVKLDQKDPELLVGVVNMYVSKNATRYSFVRLPTLEVYPKLVSSPKALEPGTKEVEIEFNNQARKFTIVGKALQVEFPPGETFRVIIAIKKDLEFHAELPPDASKIFNKNAVPDIYPVGSIDFNEVAPLYKMPEWLKVYPHFHEEPDEYTDSTFECGTMKYKDKEKYIFKIPPSSVCIHSMYSDLNSVELNNEQLRGLYNYLTNEWATLVLTRVFVSREDLMTDEKIMSKLFSLLVVPMEPFNAHNFEKLMKFPFSLDEPIWSSDAHQNSLYMNFERDAVYALRVFIERDAFINAVMKGMLAMCNSERVHLHLHLASRHRFIPHKDKITIFKNKGSQQFSIIAPTDFDGLVQNSIEIHNTEPEDNKPKCLPLSVASKHEITLELKTENHDVISIDINKTNNCWIFNTSFELLLVLKNFAFICKTLEQRIAAKKVLIDCFLSNSPFITSYLDEFADHIHVHVPSSPFDDDEGYKKLLMLLGSMIQKYKKSPSYTEVPDFSGRINRFLLLYKHEQRILTSAECKGLARYFPEFFSIKVSRPEKRSFIVPPADVHPGQISEKDSANHILMIKLFMLKYQSLVGFPFWEILPVWYQISGFASSIDNYIEPKYEKTSANVIHVSNPTNLQIEFYATLKANKKMREVCVFVSTSPQFEEMNPIGRQAFVKREPLPIPHQPDVYITIVDESLTWDNFVIELKNLTQRPKRVSENVDEIDIDSIRTVFINDMHQFACVWNSSHTEELLNNLPRYAIQEPLNNTVESIARGSTLTSQFSPTVVALKALIIHHFNYIRYKFKDHIPKTLLQSMSRFVSVEDAAEQVSDAIICADDLKTQPQLTINRYEARRLVDEGKGDPKMAIIHQLAREITNRDPNELRCKKRPWKVHFTGENAIDAGGPTRELLTEASSSFFEPTSQLSTLSPNGQRNQGNYKDTYVPFNRNQHNHESGYTAMGILLGIIIRTGLSQDIPFAPFVWKFIAGSSILPEDILQVDDALGAKFEHMKDVREDPDFRVRYGFTYSVENWDGVTEVLPGHSEAEIVEPDQIENYIQECYEFRIAAVKEPLRIMRSAFKNNVGFQDKFDVLTGALLSHMVQGSSDVSIVQFKQITIVSGFDGGLSNEFIQRFFRAFERMTKEQRKLLLKFVTTLTKLPNSNINSEFRIKIDKLDTEKPDDVLPTASTCFNKLHLPEYTDDEICLQKLVTAVQFCQTLENK